MSFRLCSFLSLEAMFPWVYGRPFSGMALGRQHETWSVFSYYAHFIVVFTNDVIFATAQKSDPPLPTFNPFSSGRAMLRHTGEEYH